MTKEITKALCKFLGEVPSLTTMTTARIQTQSGKGFERRKTVAHNRW